MRIVVEVKSESREEGVEKLQEGHFFVRVREPRRKGKANMAVIKLLKKYFGRPVTLVSGATSTIKIIDVEED